MKSSIVVMAAGAGAVLFFATRKASAATLSPAQLTNLQKQQAAARLKAQQSNSTTAGLIGILKNLTTPKAAPKPSSGGGAPKSGGSPGGGGAPGGTKSPASSSTCVFCIFETGVAPCNCSKIQVCTTPAPCVPVPCLIPPGDSGGLCGLFIPPSGPQCIPQLAPQGGARCCVGVPCSGCCFCF